MTTTLTEALAAIREEFGLVAGSSKQDDAMIDRHLAVLARLGIEVITKEDTR